MYDIYGNLLIEWQTDNEEEIVQIQSSQAITEEKFIAVLTEKNTFYTYNFELQRNSNWKQIQNELKNMTKSGMTDTSQSSILMQLVDENYHETYKEKL